MAIVLGAWIVLAAIVLPRFMPDATHEAKGTITYIDTGVSTITVEVIDPANGATREFTGIVPADCIITINGRPAEFSDLRVYDTIHARARIGHGDRGPDGSRETRLAAARIDVTRQEEDAP